MSDGEEAPVPSPEPTEGAGGEPETASKQGKKEPGAVSGDGTAEPRAGEKRAANANSRQTPAEASNGTAEDGPARREAMRTAKVVVKKEACSSSSDGRSEEAAAAAAGKLPGEWFCQACGARNGAKQFECAECSQVKLTVPAYQTLPIRGGSYRQPHHEMHQPATMAADWDCPNCATANFARRILCKVCFYKNPGISRSKPTEFMPFPPSPYLHAGGYPTPPRSMPQMRQPMGYGGPPGPWGPPPHHPDPTMPPSFYQPHPQHPPHHNLHAYSKPYDYNMFRKGFDTGAPQQDWDCWVCGNLNYAQRMSCKLCETPVDKALPRSGGGEPRPGDWFCMRCQNVNFNKRHQCKMCNAPRSSCSNEIILLRLRGTNPGAFGFM